MASARGTGCGRIDPGENHTVTRGTGHDTVTFDPGKIITLGSREAERQGGFARPILLHNPRRNDKEEVQKVTREDEERKTRWAKAYRISGTVSVVLKHFIRLSPKYS